MRLPAAFLCFVSGLSCVAAGHRFVCVDNGANRLVHVDQLRKGGDWSVDLPAGARDIQLLEADVLLVSHGSGAGEYSLKDGRLIRLISDKYRNINSARRLPDGIIILVSRSGEVFALDNEGKETGRFKIDYKNLDIRLARFNAAGNLLVVQTKEPRCVVEADMTGKVVRTVPLSGKGYRAQALENGNLLVSIGDSVKVVEIDAQGEVVHFVGGKEKHPDAGLDFFSGFELLPNGNIVVANWLGHGKQGTAPHLYEFDRQNNIVWSWEDHTKAKQVTNLLVLE